MPRTQKPKKRVEDEFEEEDEGLGLEVVQDEPELDEVERVIASLAGSKQVSATVYRELEGREQVVDRLTMHAGIDLADILQRLAMKHGHGVYRLQLREVGKNGTLRNITLPEIAEGAFGAKPAEASPPPAQPKDDPLRELLLRQNEQLMGMMREAIARPAPPPAPGASLQDQMANLAAMFRFARGLSRAAGEPDLPGWMETLGKVAAPALAAIADGIRKPPPPAAPPKPVPNEAAPLPAPAPPPAAPATAAAAEAADQAEERTPTDLAVAAVLKAAAAEARPDPERYAAIVWNIAQRELTQIAGLLPDGGLAAAVAEQVPGLKPKMDFLRALETALRAKVAAGTKE